METFAPLGATPCSTFRFAAETEKESVANNADDNAIIKVIIRENNRMIDTFKFIRITVLFKKEFSVLLQVLCHNNIDCKVVNQKDKVTYNKEYKWNINAEKFKGIGRHTKYKEH